MKELWHNRIFGVYERIIKLLRSIQNWFPMETKLLTAEAKLWPHIFLYAKFPLLSPRCPFTHGGGYKWRENGQDGENYDLIELCSRIYSDEHPRQPMKRFHGDVGVLPQRIIYLAPKIALPMILVDMNLTYNCKIYSWTYNLPGFILLAANPC